jgi:hypothetical protein
MAAMLDRSFGPNAWTYCSSIDRWFALAVGDKFIVFERGGSWSTVEPSS